MKTWILLLLSLQAFAHTSGTVREAGGYIRDLADLKAGEIRAGDRVIDNEGRLGVVVKVYEIGAAKVNYDLAFGAQAVSLANLNRAVKELGALKVGDEVELSGNRSGSSASRGTIREIFENGYVDVYIQDRTGTNLVRASEINLPETAAKGEVCSDLLRKFSEF